MIATWLRRVQQRCSNFLRGRPARSRGRSIHPRLEEFETRLTPAEVGANDFRISDMGPEGAALYTVSVPAVAYNSINHEYLVVWSGEDDVANEFEIYAQRLNAATGAPIGGEMRISHMGPDGDTNYRAFTPAVAYNSTNNEYLVVWQGSDDNGGMVIGEDEIFGQRLTATGAEVGVDDFRISSMGGSGNPLFIARNVAVTYNSTDNEYLVVWDGDDDTGGLVDNEFEIFGQRLNAATGAAVGANDFRISDMGSDGDPNFGAREPAVAYNSVNNEYLVVWAGDDDTVILVEDEREIFGQRLNAATGAEVGGNDFRISTMGPNSDPNYDARDPAVAYNSVNNEYLVVWEGDDNTGTLVDGEFEIFGQRLTATGGQVGANDFRISDMGTDGNINFGALEAAVTYNSVNNEYLVVWKADDNTGALVDDEHEVFGQRIAANGAQVGVNDFRISDVGPDVDINFQVYEPVVAYNSGSNEYLIVWRGEDDIAPLVPGEDEVFGQRFSSVDPPPPAPAPLPPPSIVGVPFRRKGRSRVRVFDATTGAFRAILTPFRGFGGRLRVEHRDVNGDGSIDLIVRAVINGKRKHKVYDAVTLASLPPVLA